MRKAFLEKAVVELVNKFDEFEKVSRSLKFDSNYFLVHKHIYMYMVINTDHFTPARAACAG